MTGAAERLPGLDLLRSIAIVWVMLFHSFVVGGLGPDWEWLSRYGWMGVDLFFVLSGFLIGTQVLQSVAQGGRFSLAGFYLRRAFRILPAYFTVLLCYLVWPGIREAPGIESGWKFAAFVVNLSIDYASKPAFSHAWSLCVEEHFYLFFPLLAGRLLQRPAGWRFIAVCASVVVAGIALRSAAWWHGMSLGPDTGRNWFIEDLYYPTWDRLDGLLAGVVLAVVKVQWPNIWARGRRHADAALLAGVALTALSFWLFRDRVGLLGNSVGWPLLSIGFGLLVFAGAGRDSLVGRWRMPGTGWLAAMSYSLYLVHKATYHVVEAHMGDTLADKGLLAFVVYAAGALAAGALLHHLVERPTLRLRERLSGSGVPGVGSVPT